MSGKRKDATPPITSDMTPMKKKKKTQTIMERFLTIDLLMGSKGTKSQV